MNLALYITFLYIIVSTKLGDDPGARRGCCGQLYATTRVAVADNYSKIRARQMLCRPLRPFHQAYRVAGKIIPNAYKFEFLRVVQPIKIEVVDPYQAELIRLDQRIGRALDRSPITYRAQKPARQCSFANTQLTA